MPDILRWMLAGLWFRYPPCCIGAFCWRGIRGETVPDGPEHCVMANYRYIPCWIHRKLRPIVWETIPAGMTMDEARRWLHALKTRRGESPPCQSPPDGLQSSRG